MEPLDLFEQRIASYGNHYQKYLITIKEYKDSLIRALETAGQQLMVPLWRSSSTPADDMRIIRDLTEDQQLKVKFLSCYYAFQYLHMHFRNLDILGLSLISDKTQTESYYEFMMRIGADFRTLTKAYIASLLEIYISPKKRPAFFACSVGTRADQDDIDIGIITDGTKNIDEFNKAMHKVSQHMLVYATPLHWYLAEQIGTDLYTSTILKYNEILSGRIHNVVILSELINARLILGSTRLFNRFQEEITGRYFYHPQQRNLYHEGFLRGILGEIRAALMNQPQMEFLAPKYDAIRLVKSFLYAKKSILRLQEVNAWDILEKLIKKDPKYQRDYEFLFKAISFLEMFKFLLQMYVVQEEEFHIPELSEEQLRAIAQTMGYKSIGMVSDWDQILIDYYQYVREVRGLCDAHLTEIAEHLADISVFNKLKYITKDSEQRKIKKKNVHFELIRQAQFFEGTKFWEDLLHLLDTDEKLLNRFISDFEILDEHMKTAVISKYVRWTEHSIITLIRLISIVGRFQEDAHDNSFFHRLDLEFLKYATDMPKSIEWFCRIYSYYPILLNQYFQVLPINHFRYINPILDQSVFSDDLKASQQQLKELCNLHQWSSRYFHRFFNRIIHSHPEYLKSLTEPLESYKVASGLLAMVEITEDIGMQKEIIAEYYDFEFLRIGIGTMKGDALLKTNLQFTEFCDNYLIKLFDICKAEIIENKNRHTIDIAILAAGGHARQQAYDDDYDLIALVDTNDEETIHLATKIISKMNREIVKRGLLPHFRLGQILGGFVNTVSQVVEYLDSDVEESFVDLSQLLGSRIIIGSDHL